MDLNAVVSTATDFLKSNSKAISLGLGGALFVWLAGKFAKSRRIRKAHDEKIKKLIEQFKASGEKDLHVASEIRALTQHTLNPHAQPYIGIHLGFSSFMGPNIARIVMSSPQGRTPETSFARFEQTNRLLNQYLHFPPDHPRAVQAIERTNWIHGRFPAIMEKYQVDMIYIWAQFAPLAPNRLHARLHCRRRLSSDEMQAIWALSKATMEKMGLSPPERWEEAEEICRKFEEETMEETKSTLRFSDILFQYFDNVKPRAPPRWLTNILVEGTLPTPIKRAAGIHSSLLTKLHAFLMFDVVMNLADAWYYYFAFTDARHSFPGEEYEDGKVGRPTFKGKEMASARMEDRGEKFVIVDVNEKYEPGRVLKFD